MSQHAINYNVSGTFTTEDVKLGDEITITFKGIVNTMSLGTDDPRIMCNIRMTGEPQIVLNETLPTELEPALIEEQVLEQNPESVE
jgi:hypothetical protein